MKQLVTSILALALTGTLSAQIFPLEADISVGYGLSAMRYKKSPGKATLKSSPNVAFGYHILINESWGFSTGLGLDFLNTEWRSDEFGGAVPYINVNDKTFIFQYTYKDYTENIRALYLTLPLMMRYEFRERTISKKGASIVPQARFGLMFGLPLYGRYTSKGNLSTVGYFTGETVAVDNRPDHGFTPSYEVNRKGNLDLRPNAWLSFSVGVRYDKPEKNRLFMLSLFCDIGLNDISRDPYAHVLEWNDGTPDTFTYNPVATSSHNKNLIPITFGLHLTYAIRPQRY